jgi:hypothetical protein
MGNASGMGVNSVASIGVPPNKPSATGLVFAETLLHCFPRRNVPLVIMRLQASQLRTLLPGYGVIAIHQVAPRLALLRTE